MNLVDLILRNATEELVQQKHEQKKYDAILDSHRHNHCDLLLSPLER